MTKGQRSGGGFVHVCSIFLNHTLGKISGLTECDLKKLNTHKTSSLVWSISNELSTLLGIKISFSQGKLEDDFTFPKVGYISSLEGSSQIQIEVDSSFELFRLVNSTGTFSQKTFFHTEAKIRKSCIIHPDR